MCRTLFGYGLGLMILAFGASGAAAAVAAPVPGQALAALPAAVPVAMCGYSCRSGGRYIPGPPSVCAEEGLNYCGPSRGPGWAPPFVRRDDRGYGAYRDEGFGRGCRTITIEREDGSIRRIRRCD